MSNFLLFVSSLSYAVRKHRAMQVNGHGQRWQQLVNDIRQMVARIRHPQLCHHRHPLPRHIFQAAAVAASAHRMSINVFNSKWWPPITLPLRPLPTAIARLQKISECHHRPWGWEMRMPVIMVPWIEIALALMSPIKRLTHIHFCHHYPANR